MERRTFLSLVTAAAGAAAAALVGIPIVSHVLSPLRRTPPSGEGAWLPVGAVGDFPEGQPRRVSVPVTVQDGWESTTADRAAWVVRNADGEPTVFTAVCPHLGCSVKWKADATQFVCPCHESGFAVTGERQKGPARRGLDPLPSRITPGGSLEIQWVEYAANVAERRPLGQG